LALTLTTGLAVLLAPASAGAQYGHGSIVGWGSHVVGGDLGGGFVALAGGGFQSLGLKADGSIVAWGCNLDGCCDVPEPNADFGAVAAGGYHVLGIKGCILGDLDCDGDVDLADLAGLLGACGTCEGDLLYNPDADLDDSGCVDLFDLATLFGNYGVGT
jgi:hypothetical protein